MDMISKKIILRVSVLAPFSMGAEILGKVFAPLWAKLFFFRESKHNLEDLQPHEKQIGIQENSSPLSLWNTFCFYPGYVKQSISLYTVKK